MLDAARMVVRHATARSREDLDGDELLALGLTKAVEIIGEGARVVTPATRALAPAIPWNLIVGTRHKLVHEYYRIDRDLLWQTVSVSVPALIRPLEELIAALETAPPATLQCESGGAAEDAVKPSEGDSGESAR